jgi:hypothetical protein
MDILHLPCSRPCLLANIPWLAYCYKSMLCYDRLSVGQSLLVSSTHLGLRTRILLLSDRSWCVDVRRSLWRENNCCWSSQAQSFLGEDPAGLVTIIYSLKFETPPTWRARSPYLYPSGTGWPSCRLRHWISIAPTLLVTVFRHGHHRKPRSFLVVQSFAPEEFGLLIRHSVAAGVYLVISRSSTSNAPTRYIAP